MNSNPKPLFSLEEAFMRLGQKREQGCLMIFNAYESAHIYVKEGFIVSATSGGKTDESAIALALHLPDASYNWMPGAEAKVRNLKVSINDYILNNSVVRGASVKSLELNKETSELPQDASTKLPDKRDSKSRDGKQAKLFFVLEEDPKVKLYLEKNTLVVGREESCDLTINHLSVSRRHCLLQMTDKGLHVQDLDSANGTRINNNPIKEGYLNSGDKLSLGTCVLLLHKEKKIGLSGKNLHYVKPSPYR